MVKADVVTKLVDNGTPMEFAVPYADAFVEYQEATKNIDENGSIVLHPRTGNPIENPYLVIRDRALKRMQSLRQVKATDLW
jgi:hypothetical protein